MPRFFNMKLFTIFALTLLSTYGLGENNSIIDYSSLNFVVTGVNEFSSHFYRNLSIREWAGNLICSPLSVYKTLSLLSHVASGYTKNELQSVLHIPNDDYIAVKGYYQALMNVLNDIQQENEMKLINGIFVSNEFTVKSKFLKMAKIYYGLDMKYVNFSLPDKTETLINSWIEQKSNFLLEFFENSNELTGITMAIFNAFYFNGRFAHKFYSENTSKFYLDNSADYKFVEMMYNYDYFNWGELPNLRTSFLELPYYQSTDTNEAISMYVLLPWTFEDLNNLEKSLVYLNFSNLDNGKRLLAVNLPKFWIENEFVLNLPLKTMGIRKLFHKANELTGIIKNGKSVTIKFIQKGYLEINDESNYEPLTGNSVVPPATPKFIANRPFLCVIVDKNTKTQLLYARILDPIQY